LPGQSKKIACKSSETEEEHSEILTSPRDLSIIGINSSITLLERAPYGTS
jgi:hypothetical protein